VVTLNGNSRLSYAAVWEEDKSREVWLEGEAYFNVRKLNPETDSAFSKILSTDTNARFVVHAGKSLDVEVLGTQFNVNQNGENVSIALHEGKVQLNIKEENQPEWVLMNPGDLVEYSIARKNYEKKVVNTAEYISWRTNVLIFNDITLGEIAQRLQRRYGYKVIFEDRQIMQERFTGNVPSDKIHLLFQMIERAFNLKIETTGDNVSISYK
jgi:ferric-dicitrate binding protein FerR (iron transport regulator)